MEMPEPIPAEGERTEDGKSNQAGAPSSSPSHLNTQHEIPPEYIKGKLMLKVTSKKRAQRVVRLLPDQDKLEWQSGTTIKTALLSEAPYFKSLTFDSILELRFGMDARNYREQFGIPAEQEDRWMSLIYVSTQADERRVKMLHLVALNDADALFWAKTLPKLVGQRKLDTASEDLCEGSKRWSAWAKQCWQIVDADKDQFVQFSDVVRLCHQLGISIKPDLLRQHFDSCDKDQTGRLNVSSFEALVKLLRRRPELLALVHDLTGDSTSTLTFEQFRDFLRKYQKSSLSDAEFIALFKTLCDSENPSFLSTENFTGYLMSSQNAAFDPHQHSIHQDMTRPLCEYFVSSSHNTYLVGNQLNSDSSAEGYIRALQGGCRCVELDVWDGSDGQPSIYHGRTLTSRLPFAEALTAIAKYGFKTSQYPILLSVEVHCGEEQQVKMAQQMRHILGDKLVDGPLYDDLITNNKDDMNAIMPSPHQLQGRILLKAKDRSSTEEAKNRSSHDRESSETTTTAESSEGELKRRLTNVMRRIRSTSNSSNKTSETPSELVNKDNSGSEGKEHQEQTAAEAKAPSKPPLTSPLASLLVYTVGVKCRGFNKKEQYHPYHVVSLGERRLNKTMKEAATDLLDHNRTHIVRSYPGGFRFTSSNYLPPSLWAMGISLVAINWQTYDLGAQINSAFFQLNGGCGYILKPDILRAKHAHAKDKEILARPSKYLYKVSILSAQQLTKGSRVKKDAQTMEAMEGNTINPLVEVALFAPGVEASKVVKYRSNVVIGNGFNPVFTNSHFEIPFEVVADMLELVFIRFQVLEGGDTDKVLGRHCVSLKALREGYRHLPLYDNLGYQFLFSTLFVRTSLESAATSETSALTGESQGK